MTLLAGPGIAAQAPAARGEAEEHYLRGREAMSRRGAEDLEAAREHFERSVAADPAFAPGWAGLAGAHALLSDYPSARDAALGALALDDTLAAAHAALGFARLHGEWDWPGAERDLRRALALDPGSATAHHWYAILLEILGRSDAAIASAARALELEPGSGLYELNLGYRLYWARRYPEAIARFREVLERQPGHASAHYFLGRAEAELGSFGPARAALERARNLQPGNLNVDAALAYLDARSGRRDDARRMLRELELLAERGSPLATHAAAVRAALGDAGKALAWLERAYRAHEGPLAWLAVDPRFDGLRERPELRSLLERMGLAAAADR